MPRTARNGNDNKTDRASKKASGRSFVFPVVIKSFVITVRVFFANKLFQVLDQLFLIGLKIITEILTLIDNMKIPVIFFDIAMVYLHFVEWNLSFF